MKRILTGLLFFTALVGTFASLSFAKVGVGIGTGKIIVDEKLKPGVIYNLPPITIFNTGTETTKYGASVEYRQAQPELLPEREWFTFEPAEFTLEPENAQTVAVKINIPLKVIPGDYFAYLEGHPIVVTESGLTAVNIAAAAKLYFTIAPANVFQGIYYRLISLWKEFEPWSTRISVVIGLVIIILVLKKNLNIEVSSKGKKKTKPISSLMDD
ncbi:hypothetical protein KKG08_02640 [Patescibacteria group bacterium]|nr:hypothetical protein [Patescibacteria group bacterium]